MKQLAIGTVLLGMLLGLGYGSAGRGQTKQAKTALPWDRALEELVPPEEGLGKVLPRLQELRASLQRAAQLKGVLDYLAEAAEEDPSVTADEVYEKLGLFRFPTPEQVSVAVEKTREPEDLLDQELFKAFDRNAGIVEVLGDPRLVKRFLASKRVTSGVMRLSRRLSARMARSRAGESLKLENVARGLGLDEDATTLELMEAAMEVFEGERDIAFNVKIKDVPFTFGIPRKAKRPATERPEVEVRNGEPVELEGLLEPVELDAVPESI